MRHNVEYLRQDGLQAVDAAVVAHAVRWRWSFLIFLPVIFALALVRIRHIFPVALASLLSGRDEVGVCPCDCKLLLLSFS